MNEDLNEIMADLSLTQDPQRQQPQPPAPRPDIIDQARGIPAPSDIVEQARVQPGFDTSRPVSVDGPMNAFAAQRMQALLDPQQQGMLPQQPPVRGMEEPPTVDDTRNLIRDMMASDSAALTASFNQVYKTNSDFAARADRMAKFLGMDMATVERNPQEVQQLFDVMDLQSRDLVRNNPALAQDLTNPGFMAIAKDDLDNLSWWTSGANAWEAGLLTAEKGKLGHELKFLDEQGLKSEGEPIRMRIAEINNRLNQLPVASEGFGNWIGSASQTVALQASFLPRAATEGAVVAGVATAVGGAVSGPLAPVVAPLAGIGGFLKVGGISQALQAMEVSSGISYLEQLEAGVSPDVAYYTSSLSGVLSGALEKLGFSKSLAPLKRELMEMTAKEIAKSLAKPAWGEIAKKYSIDVVKSGIEETASEVGETLANLIAEDIGKSFTKGELETKFATKDGRQEIYEEIADTILSTLKGQAILAPIFGSPTLFGGIQKRQAMANQQKKVLEGIANNAAESKVRKRDPNVYETIVQNQLEQLEQLGGADAKTIYVAPERFLEAMQGVGMTEAELLKLLPDQIESIREAIRNGSDIQIPTAKFASTLADTNLGRALILDMRLSDNPNVLSAREAEEQGKQLREQLETAAKMVDEDIAADKALEAEIRAVENLFYEQNVRIPNIGKDNAKALSVMQTRMVHTLARESGMPLQQFYEKYRAQFTEAGKPPMFEPQAQQAPTQGGVVINRGDKFRGEGTVEYSFDKDSLLSGRLTSMDQVQDMIESGLVRPKEGGYGKTQKPVVYFGPTKTGEPGGPFFSLSKNKDVMIVADTAALQEAAGAGTEVTIDKLKHVWTTRDGQVVDILPEILVKNLQQRPPAAEPQVGAEPAELFDSLGQRKTDTPQFKAWFGDSKVVDEQGQPLVVYHGTSATDIAAFMPTGDRAGMEKAQKVLDTFRQAKAARERFGYINFRSGTFFSPDPEYARKYTREDAGVMYPVYIKAENPVYIDQVTGSATISDSTKTPDALFMMEGGKINEIAIIDPTQIKSVNNRGTFDPASANILEQVEKLDADYMAAVERGDMETAQRMVDEAAKAAGYNQEGEHGLALGALAGGQFDPAMRGKNTRAASAELGFFFGSNKTARAYGQKTLRPESAADVSAATQSAFANIFNLVPAGTSKSLDFERDLGASAFAPDAMDEANPDAFIERIYAYANKILDDVEFRADELGNEADVLQAVEQARKQLEASVGMTDFESVTDVATVRVKLRMQNPLVHDQQGQQYRDRTYYDIIREAQAKGNDSVIIKNTYDGGPLDDIKVVFAPEQIKSADPVTRDEQGNIIPLSRRFNLQSPSILEQLGEEAQPRLMAVHNLTADNLRFADGIGGLAVPSVGVVTEEAGEVRGFGEITLIGTKSMIDPAREPVFTSDAYSQRFPRPEWRKPKVKDADALYNQVKDVSKEFNDDIANYVDTYAFLRPNAGELLGRWLISNATKALWLRSKGETAKPVLRDTFADNDYGFTKEIAERLKPTFDAWRTAWNEAEPKDRMSLPETEALATAVKREYAKVLIDGGVAADEANRIASELRGIGTSMTRLFDSMARGPKPDFTATREALDKQIAGRESEFRKWSEEQVLGRFPAPYLTIGRRKVPYTLNNIVEFMTDPTNVAGAEKTMTFGPGMVRAMTSERLESLEQMREAAKTSIVEGAEYDKVAKETQDKMSAYRDAVYSYSTESGMAPLDAAMRALAKFATRKTRTVEQLRKELAKEYYDAAKIPVEALELGVEAAEALLKAPVPYFEAKPQRAVNLNEFAGAVIPQDATQETKDLLTTNGIPFTTYASDTERTAVVRQFTQQLSQQRGDVLSQLADGPNPGFYSALLRSMDAVTAKALPANGWKDQIRGLVNKGTVKQAEVEWSGLNEWLDMQEGKVTKEAVVAFLQGYGVKVEAVQLGSDTEAGDTFSVVEDEDVGGYRIVNDTTGEVVSRRYYDRIEAERDAQKIEREDAEQRLLPTKFGHYVLPNGKDYREVLLILPIPSGPMSVSEIDARLKSLALAMEYTADRDAFNEMAETKAELLKERISASAKQPRFVDDQHWGRDDVLAHLRMNDRVDADGKRVLFIEEIQSDWGQKGREQGFNNFAATKAEYDKAEADNAAYTEAVFQKSKELEDKFDKTFEFMSLDVWLAKQGFSDLQINDPAFRRSQGMNYESDRRYEYATAYDELVNKNAELLDLRKKQKDASRKSRLLYEELTKAPIPRAPFVETTKGWVELALKKVMLIAAEGGYDRVAFTNGAENAERYNLSKRISKILYNQKTYALIAFNKNGGEIFDQKVSPDKLHEYVGGEIAQKLTSESMRPTVMSREQYQSQYGLETMETQLLIRQINMGDMAIKDPTWFLVSNNRIIGEYQSQQEAQENHHNTVQLEGLDLEVGGEGMKAFYDKIMPNYLKDLLAKFGKTKPTMVNVEGIGEHLGFDVTPELLDKISEGLPLFSPKQRGTFDPRTLVSAIMSGGKSDTVMHEMWHYYFVMLERFALAGDAPPKLAQDFDTLLAWLKVPGATADERFAAWRNMTFEQRKPYHENTAYAWEIWLAKGEAPSVELEGIFKRMLRWFRETYNDIVTELKALYRQNYGRELILPTSEIEQIFARALASQEEIDRAMVVRNIQFPYSDAEQAQMRPETLGALKEMWEEMVEEAVINVTGKSISDMQWLSGAETPAMREMQKRHDTLREQVREQVAEQVRMEPIYRAMRHFQTGEMVAEDGTVSNAGSNYKLNSRMTQALLPEGKTLTNLRGMTNRKGLDPSEVAQWYGYPDGKTFVAALANAKPMTEEIKERTDKRMLEEHGDLVNPVQRQRAIERAINNDTRTQFLAAVLRHTDMALRKSVDALSPAAVKQVEQATAKLAELKQTREALRAQLRQAEEAKLAEVIDATNEQLRDNQRAIARERRKISGPITPVRDLVKAAERNADQTLATKKVGEVSSYRYGQQQARASRDAQEAVKKMDLAEVVRAQQKELILHALTKKAAEFEDFVADKLDDYRKFTKDTEKLRKTRDMDLVNVAKAILASYGMGVEVDGIDKRLERFKEANPELYAEFEGLITDAKTKARPYRELTVEEFQAVTDAVDRLWYEAKRRLEVGKEGERQALGEVVDLMLDRLVKIGLDAVLPGTTGKETEAEKLAVQVVDMASCVTRIQHWCNKMDELTFGLEAGVFTKNIWRRIQNATSEYLLARDKEIKELADLSKALYTGGPTIYSKHLGYTFGRDRGHSGKAEIMGMWLQAGNRDNLERLLTNREITMNGHPDKGKLWGAIDEVTGELDTSRFMAATQEFIEDGTLTEADFDWFQSMWDKMDQITEKYLQPAHKQQTGDYLDLIPPDSFTIRFKDGKVKTYRGGYMPSKIDPAVSSKGRDIENFTELEQDVRQRRPKAADGMTKKRVKGATGARIMDPMLVVQAIDEELRYSILGPAINDVLKIANDERLNEAMNRFDRNFIKKTLIPWLNVVATQRITQPPLGGQLSGRVFTGLRTAVAMQALGFNVLNAAQNITGIPTGIYKAGPITYAKAVAEFIYNPKKVIDVIVNSDGIMAERLRLTMFDAETEMKRIFENPSAFNTTMTYVRSSMMILQKVSQNLIDITVWLASYNKAMRSMGADKNNAEAHAEAVRRARETVTLTQYSQRPEDVAKIEVKPAEVRVFTQFFGYINGLAQLAGGEWKKYIRSDLGLPSKAAGLVYIYLLCWLAPSLINDLLKRAATDDWEDEDDNGYIDGMFYDVAIKPSMQSVPVVGQVAELAANGFDDKPYNDRLNIAPAVSMVSGAVSEAAKSANKWIRSGELGEEQIYDWITLMGYLTKFPTRPFVKPLEYEAQVEAGKVTPTSSYDYYRGLITGRASPESKQ